MSAPDSPPAKRAFVSHSGPDDRYVAEFVQLVRSLGFAEVFNDSHTIEPDEKFWERIERGIRECDAFVVILSRASVQSQWVDKEVQFARAQGRRVIPIRIDDCTLPPSFDGRDVIELKHVGQAQRIHPPKFLHHNAELFLGRDAELALLDRAWAGGLHVLSLIAWGGVGKTALIVEWVRTRFIEKDWQDATGRPDPLTYFDWSFYDQGTRNLADGTSARTGNVGDFFEVALQWFGDPDPNLPGKGTRLARLVQQQCTLLILDGLEPLQQPVGHPQAGHLLDPDLRDLLCALAAQNPGLCLLTSRQAIADLGTPDGRTTEAKDLDELPKAVAVRLLQKLAVTGSVEELEKAAEDFGCHALSLTLLGRFLVDAHGGDIRRIDQVRLHEADNLTRPERHRTAWKVLSSYHDWLTTAQSQPETLAVLRLLGLFDRPATPDCLGVLRKGEVIPGLTEHLHGLSEAHWNTLLKRLERAHLLKLRETTSSFQIDAHPLVREYFAEQLRTTQPEAWRSAHSRLFDHLCISTEPRPDTLLGLQPLYQAVTHGCLAERQQEALYKVYVERILRGMGNDGFYSTKKLGAIGADLGAVAAFFEQPWISLSPHLSAPDQAWLLNEAALRLRALGRLTEALEPMRVSLQQLDEAEDWHRAAVSASNLSELEVTLGRLSDAVADGRRAIAFADRSGDAFLRMAFRATAADALHLAGQTGQRSAALALFVEAERMQTGVQPHFPLLYSLRGFQYADLLMVPAERAAWEMLQPRASVLECASPLALSEGVTISNEPSAAEGKSGRGLPHSNTLRDVRERTTQTLQWVKTHNLSLLSIALDHLTLARAALYRALLTPDTQSEIINHPSKIDSALSALRESNNLHHLPKALLTAALHAGTLGRDLSAAARYLDEAQQIAERGPMPLYLADVHLHRARLFGRLPAAGERQNFPHIDPKAELAKARALIAHHAYGRRHEELATAEAAATGW